MESFAELVADVQDNPIASDESGAGKPKQATGFTLTKDLLIVLDRVEIEKAAVPNESMFVRISDLPYLCIRQLVLAQQHKVVTESKLPERYACCMGLGTRFTSCCKTSFLVLSGCCLGRGCVESAA